MPNHVQLRDILQEPHSGHGFAQVEWPALDSLIFAPSTSCDNLLGRFPSHSTFAHVSLCKHFLSPSTTHCRSHTRFWLFGARHTAHPRRCMSKSNHVTSLGSPHFKVARRGHAADTVIEYDNSTPFCKGRSAVPQTHSLYVIDIFDPRNALIEANLQVRGSDPSQLKLYFFSTERFAQNISNRQTLDPTPSLPRTLTTHT